MKTRLLTLLIALCAVLCTVQGKNGLLWKVSGGDTKVPSYILGTHHLAPASMIDSIIGLREALESVDAIYGEVADDGTLMAQAQTVIMQYAMAPADSTLTSVLTPQQYALVDSVLSSYLGMPGALKYFDVFKPALVDTQIGALQIQSYTDSIGSDGLFDSKIMAIGKDLGKTVKGLETIEDQVQLLFGSPITDQVKSLVETAENNDEYRSLSQDLIDVYMKQDLDAVNEFMAKVDDPQAQEALLNKRNHNWVERLQEILPNESVLIVVGCGHLPGENGLINLLCAKGYQVGKSE